MEFISESTDLNDYLKETDVVNFSHPFIKEKVTELFNEKQSEIEKAKIAYTFVRDQIAHSWDIQSTRITCKASDVLKYKEGICYAKSILLAALLRSQGIPTGFCYQRLMIFDTPDKGYSLHALNGVFLSSLNSWIRLDARGNKPGVQAEFSIDEETLAFSIQEYFDEKDYPIIYIEPNANTIAVLEENINAIEMYKYSLPDVL
ncbi:transglutaminase family protein [Lederbergia wuyishanensis]|uniref:Transglutaminase-like putative cysteine protease n=1 Tax=Lederbergia wuyishanensis TaxID=1347903 RepID=A0ABU0D9U7_9BACI|nr:transglutaminase family protein [Lederbergia wuyishanensis]MCJ8008451.1 transglutaminase family protein [Lederbergia wuyishanensis]MDQ0345194.1 transglutaminase-like putative cysteine protease [Lederbergia wuyishanensis]